MSGLARISTFSADIEASFNSSLESLNLSFSYCALTNALITLMAMRFSCTEEFSPSNFFIIRLNLGRAMLPIMPRNISRNGIAMRNILARGALILWA